MALSPTSVDPGASPSAVRVALTPSPIADSLPPSLQGEVSPEGDFNVELTTYTVPACNLDATCKGHLVEGEVPLQGDFSAEHMIYGVADVDAARRDHLVELLDIDLTWRMHRVSDGQRRRVQICMGLLRPFQPCSGPDGKRRRVQIWMGLLRPFQGGGRRSVQICMGLLRPFQVLLLDEVTVDLDVVARMDLLSFFQEECEERGATVVYATHIFDGLESWASHLAFVSSGKLQRLESVDQSTQQSADSHKPSALQLPSLLEMVEPWLREDKAKREKEVEEAKKRGDVPKRVDPFAGAGRHMAYYRYGPLPGRHCSVLLVVRPGDLLLPDEEQIGTFYRHLDPKTSSKLHEEEAANVLRSEVADTGLLAVNAFAWSLEHLDDVHRSYDPLIIENPKLVGLKALRLELVHYVEKAALNIREAASTVGRGVGTGIALGGEAEEAAAGSHSGGHGPTDGGEEEHEREDKEGGGEEDGGSDEEEEDEEREDDDVVTGEEEAVQFAGEKVADKSSGSGPKSGKKARGSGGSIPTRMASKAAVELLKAAERENKKLREEKVVAEKRLEYQTARMDTLFGVVTSTVNKLTTVADSVTSHEQTLGRSLQTGVDAMRAVEQEAVNYRGSTLEFMNQRWLPTVQALYLTATAAQGRRREDDVLLLQGVADALGEKIRTVVSAEVKAAMESEAQGIAAAVTTKVIKELRDDLVKVVTSATQHGLGTAGFSLLPTALESVMHGGRETAEEHGLAPRQLGKRVADKKSLTGE
ncbi:unnamed protein product [Closterium sp. NIES-65]|nr:unnamed protein product [Closterium sp. NIES-65]